MENKVVNYVCRVVAQIEKDGRTTKKLGVGEGLYFSHYGLPLKGPLPRSLKNYSPAPGTTPTHR